MNGVFVMAKRPVVRISLFLVFTLPLVVFSWLSHAVALESAGQIYAGDVYQLNSKILGEYREIYVSLPENYGNSAHHYPVVFVLDAEYLFELTNSIIKIQSSRNYMPESIVIGIPNNTGKRLDMALELFSDKGAPFFYGENIGQADKYLAFFRNELFPLLEAKFRVNEHRTVIGLSPSFGPVLQAFWSEPDLFRGYIVLAAEIGQYMKSGEMVADKIVNTIEDKSRKQSAIYIGTSSNDIAKRGDSEAKLYENIPSRLAKTANPNIHYKFEIIPNEDHYSMVIKGIHSGLETIYPREKWDISYRRFWNSPAPAKALEDAYKQLSTEYGFEIIPIEKGFYSVNNLVKTAEILKRQDKKAELLSWLKLAIKFYPQSQQLNAMLKNESE